MLALIGFALLILSAALWWGTLRFLGIYRRVPVENYVLFVIAAGIGLYAVVERPSIPNGALVLVSLAMLGALVWYVHFAVGSTFPREELALRVGDRFPEISLPDSEGQLFQSASMEGVASALYLFYRGDW
jgi:hypothetical protein